jgi:hypothetical protein
VEGALNEVILQRILLILRHVQSFRIVAEFSVNPKKVSTLPWNVRSFLQLVK